MRNSVYNQGIYDSTENFESYSPNVLDNKSINNFKKGTEKMIQNTQNLHNKILNLQENIEKHTLNLDNQVKQLDETNSIIESNKEEIRRKMEILENRNKQVQLTIDRNIYYKKMTYVWLSIVIFIFVAILLGFSYFKK